MVKKIQDQGNIELVELRQNYYDNPMSIMLEAYPRWNAQMLLWLDFTEFSHQKGKTTWNDSECYADHHEKVPFRQGD